jgi:hypothetical protein
MQARGVFEQEQYPGKIDAAEERCVPAIQPLYSLYGQVQAGSGSAKSNGARTGHGAGAFCFEDPTHEDRFQLYRF